MLSLVFWLDSKRSSSSFTLESANIADLEVLLEDSATTHIQYRIATSKHSEAAAPDLKNGEYIQEPQAPPIASNIATSSHTVHSFDDPAIVSLQRPLTQCENGLQAELPQTEAPFEPSPLLEEAALRSPTLPLSASSLQPAVPITTKPKMISPSTYISVPDQDSKLASATLSEPFNGLALDTNFENARSRSAELGNDAVAKEISQPSEGKSGTAKRRRRTKPKGANEVFKDELLSAPRDQMLTSSVQGQQRLSTTNLNTVSISPPARGKGPVRLNGTTPSRKMNQCERIMGIEAQNGWATGDATDIQEMGEFDFEANLSKFDKRSIFDQLRRDDTTADEARLVHHNRLPPKPGTSGGKNLHWTENVLDSLTPKMNGYAKWNSEAGESENELSDDARISSGRSTKRSLSRATTRRPSSRKGSGIAINEGFRISTTSLSSMRRPSLDHHNSNTLKSNVASTPTKTNPSLRISTSNKLCPCLSPLKILEFEQYGISDLGMTEEMMTENAARGIAETVTRLLRSLSASMANSSVTILAGNHKSGARAIAAARHLCNHGIHVSACILGSEREENLLESIKQQTSAYRKAGGKLYTPSALSDALKGGQIQPTLVVDALLSIHTCFDDLRRDEQATYFDIVLWVNRNNLEVMSLDVPSGIDVSSGENQYPLSITID